MNTEIQTTIFNNTIGKWTFNDLSVSIDIEITEELFNITFNGVIEQYKNNASWMGESYLIFGNKYNVTYADKDILIFGKQRTAVVNDYDWKYEFKRAS